MTPQITYLGRMLTCLRCGGEWYCRIQTRPVACPRCHSTRYDIPRKEKAKGTP